MKNRRYLKGVSTYSGSLKQPFTVIVAVLLLLTAVSLSANEEVGTTGFNFLRVAYSARAAAMANSYTGLADDVNAVFYNPAGLVQMSGKSLSTSYISYFEGFHGGSIAYAFPLNEKQQMAVFSQYLGTDSITRTEVDKNGVYMGTSGTFGTNNIVFGLSGSMYIHEMLNIGLTGKMIREQLDDKSAIAAALDVALLHHTTNEKIILGVVLKNLGTQFTYFTDEKYKEKFPFGAALGFRYMPHEKINVVLDLNKSFDTEFKVNGGIEYSLHPMLDIRTGYDAQANDWKAGGDYDFLSGITFGLGFTRNKYNIDYAISSFGDLGFVNQFTIKYSF